VIKKGSYYRRFLNAVMKSSVLKGSEFLLEFVKEPNEELFRVKKLNAENE
jgi:hypothetical protein